MFTILQHFQTYASANNWQFLLDRRFPSGFGKDFDECPESHRPQSHRISDRSSVVHAAMSRGQGIAMSLTTTTTIRTLQRNPHTMAKPSGACSGVKSIGKQNDGKPHARFDYGVQARAFRYSIPVLKSRNGTPKVLVW